MKDYLLNQKHEKIRITQVHSPIGRVKTQRSTLIGLGLNKMYKTVLLPNNSSIHGMIDKVRHLLSVELV